VDPASENKKCRELSVDKLKERNNLDNLTVDGIILKSFV
jgi:hypothetical protein